MIESRFFYSAQERLAPESFAAAGDIAETLRECHDGSAGRSGADSGAAAG
jgi:hypothetical protein